MSTDFSQVMSKKSNAALIEILNSPKGHYVPEAFEAAKSEFESRNLSEEDYQVVKNENSAFSALKEQNRTEPLSLFWKCLSFLFPGIIPLVVAGSFKVDGYDRKAKEVIRWTLYGVAFYVAVVILSMILFEINAG